MRGPADQQQQDALAQVHRATRSRLRAETAWRRAIREAHEAGCSLRLIAHHAGVTNPRVHQILSEQEGDDAR
jgi:hypothetical protein